MWCKSKIFWYFVVVCADVLGCWAALKQGDNGVCVVKISVRKSRIRILATGRMCGKRKCIVKKLEYYNTPEKRIACCNGWQYNVTSETCGPVCSTGCIGGRCAAPEICHCDPPNYLDPEHRNACLQPKCDPSCVNAQCEANNTCTCHTNHSRFNATHCFKCDPGYIIGEDFKCTPVCEEECVNGKCSEPNKCTCLEGYQSGNVSNSCEPKCVNCVNSICVAPNKCSCLEDYKEVDDSTCEPVCELCGGECVDPNVCDCGSGYTNTAGVCMPVCEGCDYGVCTAPGVCKDSCNEVAEVEVRIRKTRTSTVATTLTCRKEKECTVKKVEHYTTSEKRRVCCNDWQFNATSDSCEPMCTSGCIGGRCAAPETCYCDAPNYLDPKNGNACLQPKCDPLCVNAQCEANNTCSCHTNHSRFNATHCLKCDPGYNIGEDFKCTPVCDKECVNGECSEPNKCTCLEGYQSGNVSNSCEPKCDNCVNSKCVAPNKCSCLEGYAEVDDSTCEPVCELCGGECVAPNVCDCGSGYANTDGVCIPVCEGCDHGVCTAPGVCKDNCNEVPEVRIGVGLKYDVIPGHECTPPSQKCSASESRAQKTKAGHICCKKKFSKETSIGCCSGWKHIEDKCEAQCINGCQNGRCVLPNICVCDPPLVLNNNECVQAVCEPECFNGICVGTNQCNCTSPFKYHNSTHCAPTCARDESLDPATLECYSETVTCDQPCQNAECTRTNECTCYKGYKKTGNFTCEPECVPTCGHGDCISPNKCQCHKGYERKDSNCVPICKDCKNGVCEAPEKCICNSGYIMENNTCISVEPEVMPPDAEPKVSNTSEVLAPAADPKVSNTSEVMPPEVDAKVPITSEEMPPEADAKVSNTSTAAAGLELSWTLGGAVICLLVILVVAVMFRIYRNRKLAEKKIKDAHADRYGSVVYTVPDTLLQHNDNDDVASDVTQTTQRMLHPEFGNTDRVV